MRSDGAATYENGGDIYVHFCLLVYIALLVGFTLLGGAPASFVDMPSIIVILVLSFSMLLASGLLPDLVRGFKIMGRRENTYSSLELRKTDIAVGLSIKLLLLSGFVGFMIGLIGILAAVGDPALLGRNLAVAMVTLFYALLLIVILLPVRAKVRAIIETLD